MSSYRDFKDTSSTRRRITVPDSKQTTDATQTTAFSLLVPEASALFIQVRTLAIKSDVSASQSLIVEGCFRRASGGNIVRASGDSGNIKPILRTIGDFPLVVGKVPELDLVANTSTQSVDIKITGQAAITINWYFDILTLRNKI